MIDEKLARKAFEVGINYLSVSARSEKEVKEKLYKKGFHQDVVDATLEKLKGYRYIDDEQYVSSFLSFYAPKYGRKTLSYKLIVDKGVEKTLVENSIADKISDEDELEKGLGLATKYVVSKKVIKQNKSKLANWLFSKGFDWDIINKVTSKIEYYSLSDEEKEMSENSESDFD